MFGFYHYISTLTIKSLHPILCLFIFKCTKNLSSLGVQDKFFSFKTEGTIFKFENTGCNRLLANNITFILHFPLHTILLVPNPNQVQEASAPRGLPARQFPSCCPWLCKEDRSTVTAGSGPSPAAASRQTAAWISKPRASSRQSPSSL